MRTGLFVSVLLFSFALPQADSISLDLSAWVSVALENSPDMAVSSADLMAAEASLRSSRSFLYPTVGLSSSVGRTWSSVPDPSGGYTDVDDTRWSLSLSASQEILGSGGASWLRLRGSGNSLEASRLDRERAKLDLTLEVVEAYYGVVEALGLLESSRRALDRSRQQLSRTSSLYEIGASTNLEMIQAEVQESSDSLAVLQRRQAVMNAYTALYRAAGVPGSTFTVNTRAVLDPVSVATAEGYRLDISRNRSVAASERRVEAAEYSYRAGRRSYWPSLNASGSWSWSNSELDFEEFSDRDAWQVSLSLQWTLFDGFSRESMIQSQRAALLRQQASHEVLENAVSSSVETARNNLISSIGTWELSLQVLNQAQEKLRLSRMSYELGGITLLNLLEAQSEVASAEASVESSRAAALVAEARLLVLLGRNPRVGE